MKKIQGLFIFMLSLVLCIGAFSIDSFAAESNVKDKILEFMTQCEGKQKYISADKTINESQKEFVTDAWKYIYGTELTISDSTPKYNITSIKTIPIKAVAGDVIVFAKGNDVYYTLYISGNDDSIEYYNIEIFPYSRTEKLCDGDTSKFMDGRFKNGTFTIIHSDKYSSANHVHAYNHDGYCSCGKPKNGTITDCSEKKYIILSKGLIYSLPYTGSSIVETETPSAYPITVTGYTTNVENQLWYRVSTGWIRGTSVSDTPSSSYAVDNKGLNLTGVINKENVAVKSRALHGSLLLGKLNKGDSVIIRKKTLSWYQIVFNTEDNTNAGYVMMQDIDLTK